MDLQLYAGDTVPPPRYSLDTEVAGITAMADASDFGTFHLVGYSAGGAVSLAFVARHPRRVRSLALMEPAWAGRHGQDAEEAAVFDRLRAVADLPSDQVMSAFVRAQLADDIEPPAQPSGPPPPWMPSRVASIGTLLAAFDAYEPDRDVLRQFDRPVYFALGGRSNPHLYPRIAARLARIFPDLTLDLYEDRHHFDPPHRIEPARVATALRDLWSRADATRPVRP